MDTVTEVGTAVVKYEDLLDATEATELSHLSPEAMAVQEALLEEMAAVRGFYS